MIEAGVVVTQRGSVHWHLPTQRSSVELPDSRDLWEVLWSLRAEPRLGFAHSHPGHGRPMPSHTDLTTFVAVELGLGRRLDWWITSADTTVILTWIDDTLRYSTLVVPDPEWVPLLRAYSQMYSTPTRKEP